MKVTWDEESVKEARFSERGLMEHGDYITEHGKGEREAMAQSTMKELMRQYSSYGTLIKPPRQ